MHDHLWDIYASESIFKALLIAILDSNFLLLQIHNHIYFLINETFLLVFICFFFLSKDKRTCQGHINSNNSYLQIIIYCDISIIFINKNLNSE